MPKMPKSVGRKRAASPSGEELLRHRGREEMARCSGALKCGCLRTQQELDNQPSGQVARGKEKPAKGAKNPYPPSPSWIVHFDPTVGRNGDWVCSDCDHPISRHPPSRAPVPATPTDEDVATLSLDAVESALKRCISQSSGISKAKKEEEESFPNYDELFSGLDEWEAGSIEDYKSDLINGELIDRDSTLNELTTFVCRLVDAGASKRSINDKVKFPIAFAVCGSGGGKSTLCAIVEDEWKNKIKERMNSHIEEKWGKRVKSATSVSTVFVTFNSTCNYDAGEAARLSHEASLGIRLLASRKRWSHKDTTALLNDYDAIAPYANLKLDACLAKIVPQDENEALIILVDEILALGDANAIQSTLLQLSNFQQECLRSHKKVFVLVTSLSSELAASLSRATRPVAPISLPPISPEEVLRQAWKFVERLRSVRGEEVNDHRHHLISEFCATGGLVKNMKKVTDYFSDTSNPLTNIPLQNEWRNYDWARDALCLSVFMILCDTKERVEMAQTSSSSTPLQDLLDNHLVAVVGSALNLVGMLRVRIRIPTHILRGIAAYGGNLTTNEQEHLRTVTASLAENRGGDGSYAKPFDVALLRVLCLRLSLTPKTITLKELLPGCSGTVEQDSVAYKSADCEWVKVENLTKREVQKKRTHGTMVYSELVDEKAIEGFWYLLGPDEKPFVLFLQMKFWEDCAPGKISTWETKVHNRAKNDFGLAAGIYAVAFFSTSETFQVGSSLAMPKKAVEELLEPFGVCPMMLYAEERSKMSRRQ